MDLLNVLARHESLESVDKIFSYIINEDVYIGYHIKIKHSLNVKQFCKRILL